MTSLELVHLAVSHYLKHVFKPILIEGEKKIKYMEENALRISLGKRFDYSEYCVWLADNAPRYGIIVKSYVILKYLRMQKRLGKWKHSKLSKQIQVSLRYLAVDTQVLVILNASQFLKGRLQRIFRSWPSTKPILLIG